MTSLKDITKRITVFRDARDWKQFHAPKDMLLSLGIEVAELAEHFQWKNGDELKTYLDQHRSEVADELADVLYWVLLLGHDLDIDLSAAFEKKMMKNEAKYPVEKAAGKSTKYSKL